MLEQPDPPVIPDLASHVRRRLEQWLGAPEWQQGGRLPPEGELAKKFGVSRPTLRKALLELRDDGRIVSRRGSGNFVQPTAGIANTTAVDLTIRTTFDMKRCLQFRMSIEMAAAAEAAVQRDTAAVGAMRRANERLMAVTKGTSVFESDFSFHLTVAHATLNPYFPYVLETIKDQIRLTIEFTRELHNRPVDEVEPRVVEEHKEIVEAIERGSPEEARLAMENHMRQTLTRLLDE